MTYLHADGNQVAVGRERPNNVVPGKRLERGTTTYNVLLRWPPVLHAVGTYGLHMSSSIFDLLLNSLVLLLHTEESEENGDCAVLTAGL
jgi:hypothetical protein